jgi:hypothetical protein
MPEAAVISARIRRSHKQLGARLGRRILGFAVGHCQPFRGRYVHVVRDRTKTVAAFKFAK